MSKFNRLVLAIVWSPLLWGMAASLAFYAPMHTGYWTHAMVLRYFAGHWVEYVTTALFFVGLAAVAIKYLRTAAQYASLDRPLLDAIPAIGQPISHCENLLGRLAKQPESLQDSYLVRRLRDAIEYVHRKGSAETLDDELRFLSDVDAARMHSSYALIRIIIWAVPILGFLGTVIGITEAVASLSPQALENSLPTVTAGLGVAFDTTALSLGLSMVLMFSQFLCERYEGNLVSQVDARASAALVGRFEVTAAGADPQVATVRRIAETMLQATEKLVAQQVELWQSTITQVGSQLEAAMKGALTENLKQHALSLAETERTAAEQNRKHWRQLQDALLQNAEAVTLQQQELVKQGDVLLKVVGATGDISQLENTLNQNLGALAGAKNFEETVISLSAAIQLLSNRLGQLPSELPRVDLKASRKGHAA